MKSPGALPSPRLLCEVRVGIFPATYPEMPIYIVGRCNFRNLRFTFLP